MLESKPNLFRTRVSHSKPGFHTTQRSSRVAFTNNPRTGYSYQVWGHKCFLTVPGSIPTAKGVTTFEHRVELGSWEDRQRLCGESSRELSDYRTKWFAFKGVHCRHQFYLPCINCTHQSLYITYGGIENWTLTLATSDLHRKIKSLQTRKRIEKGFIETHRWCYTLTAGLRDHCGVRVQYKRPLLFVCGPLVHDFLWISLGSQWGIVDTGRLEGA